MIIYFYKVCDPYGCFSNFSPHSIRLRDQIWPTVEHYYQAQKFIGTEDQFLSLAIHKAKTPKEAASLGRDPSYQIRSDWEQVKTQVMREAVLSKFLTHLDVQAILLATGDALIVEDSPRDAFWGCGPDKKGLNQLGKILMNVRQEIRATLSTTHPS
jgi:hypothetical protein